MGKLILLFKTFSLFKVSTILWDAFKFLKQRTETVIISKEAVELIKDAKKAEELREVIQEYHNKGRWNHEKIESVTAKK